MLLIQQGRRQFCDALGREDAPAVCFVHSLSADSDMWADQVPPLLAQDYRVIRIDLRGHGASEAGEGDYSIDGLADDVLSVLDTLAIPDVHFVGLSIGGMVGQSLAIRHPSRLKTAVLCDTLSVIPLDRHPTFRSRIAEVEAAGTLKPTVEHGLSVRFTDDFRTRNPKRWEQMRRNYETTSVDGYLRSMAALISFDFSMDLARIELPVLVIGGDQDPSSTPETGKQIAKTVRNGVYQEIANTRHLPNVERPEAFNRILLDWLNHHRQ